MRAIGAVVWALLVTFGGGAAPSARPSAAHPGSDDPTFKSAVDLVALSVTVTNGSDKQVRGLTADDFVVVEDGVRQAVTFFSAEDVPLDVAVLMDASASMQGKIELARRAATGLVESLRPGDRASVVEFRDSVRIRQPLTADLSAVDAALAQITPGGATSMYDALYIALKELARAERDPQRVRRQAIVLLSDGDDTASLSSAEDVLEVARRGGVVVYAVSLKSAGEKGRELALGPGDGDHALRAVTRDTGGRVFFPESPGQLKGIYAVIADELASQYALGYVPSNATRDGAWRRVGVQVLQGGARPRTRTGYFAAKGRPPTSPFAPPPRP